MAEGTHFRFVHTWIRKHTATGTVDGLVVATMETSLKMEAKPWKAEWNGGELMELLD